VTSPAERLAVSIVVVAYVQRDPLIACLDSCAVAAAELADDSELILVDNGNLASAIRARHPSAVILEPGSNIGFAGAVNLALERCRGRWVALVNDDATLEPDALRRLVEAGERSATTGAVAAQVRFNRAAGRVNSAGIAVDRIGVATERFAGAATEAADESAEVFGPSGCCALYRRAMLAQLGGFDTRFFAYLEDVDLAWRAQARGWSCVYEARAVVHHEGSASSRHGSARKYFLVGRNRVWLLARNMTRRQLLRALPTILLYDVAYVAYVAARERTLAPLRGRLAGLRSWRQVRRGHDGSRGRVALGPLGWRAALAQHRAYREFAGS
jgi:GT2 family glycosyltransferase